MKVSFGNMAHSMGKGMHMGHGSIGGHFHVVHHSHNVHHIHVRPRSRFKFNFGSRASSQQFRRGMNQGFKASRAKTYRNASQAGNKTNVGQYVSQMIKHDNKIKSMQKAKDQQKEAQNQPKSRKFNKKSLLQQMIDAIDDVGQHMQQAQRWQGPQR